MRKTFSSTYPVLVKVFTGVYSTVYSSLCANYEAFDSIHIANKIYNFFSENKHKPYTAICTYFQSHLLFLKTKSMPSQRKSLNRLQAQHKNPCATCITDHTKPHRIYADGIGVNWKCHFVDITLHINFFVQNISSDFVISILIFANT